MIITSLVLLASASVPAAPAVSGTMLMQAASRVLGGYNNADVNNAQVQEAAAFAAASVDAELGEVTSAQVQSAAGSNYRITFTTSDGRSYAAVVRRDLRATTYRMTSIEETGDDHTDIAQEQADAADSEE